MKDAEQIEPPPIVAPPVESPATRVPDLPVSQDVARHLQQRNLVIVAAFFLGAFGVHKFLTKRDGPASVMLGVSFAGVVGSCFVLPLVLYLAMLAVAWAEAIIYARLDDEEYVTRYLISRRGWF